jgi:xanthine dehydrogenase iron-sulfur cluster and FAD-binding subunit A
VCACLTQSAASLAGNIVTASPISDLNPIWLAMDASFVLASAVRVVYCVWGVCASPACSHYAHAQARGERSVRASDFFIGYRQTALKSDEVLVRAVVPLGGEYTYPMAFKQSQRREDDIAIVTCALRIDLDKNLVRVCSLVRVCVHVLVVCVRADTAHDSTSSSAHCWRLAAWAQRQCARESEEICVTSVFDVMCEFDVVRVYEGVRHNCLDRCEAALVGHEWNADTIRDAQVRCVHRDRVRTHIRITLCVIA